MENRTFFLYCLGCKVNSYENSALRSIFLARGYKEDNINPDIIVINTCSVTATADQKSRQHIRSLRKKHPNSVLCVMGCYSQKMHEFVINELNADIVIGTNHRSELAKYIDQYYIDHIKRDYTEDNPFKFSYEEMSITSFSENVRSYLKIQDGCNNFCTYCLIPYLRGKTRSRDFDTIIKEAKEIVNNGFKEIVLTGIHVGGYGKDLNNHTFSDLVEALSDIEGLKRITISSIDEAEIDDKLIELFKTRDNLAHHIHVCLQSGSSSVLKRMNRHYNTEEFYNKISKIKEACPDVAITTDVIVGFPQESEEEFNETYEFIKKCNFAMLHVFPFSPREGTIAAKMKGQISSEIKKDRTQKLIKLSNSLWNQFLLDNNNKEMDILVESYDENTKMCYGHSSNYIGFSFKGKREDINQIIKVKFNQ